MPRVICIALVVLSSVLTTFQLAMAQSLEIIALRNYLRRRRKAGDDDAIDRWIRNQRGQAHLF